MSTFPTTRLRRLRRTPELRALVRETRLHLDDFVMPLFVAPEPLANPELPGLARHSLETAEREVTVDVASVQFQGHAGHDGPIFSPDLPEHTKWGDIIPPFDFGEAGSYAGKNWTARCAYWGVGGSGYFGFNRHE